jgi:hypothetical protein
MVTLFFLRRKGIRSKMPRSRNRVGRGVISRMRYNPSNPVHKAVVEFLQIGLSHQTIVDKIAAGNASGNFVSTITLNQVRHIAYHPSNPIYVTDYRKGDNTFVRGLISKITSRRHIINVTSRRRNTEE